MIFEFLLIENILWNETMLVQVFKSGQSHFFQQLNSKIFVGNNQQ